ncbi:short-chain dehydrogenase [Gammaproteobacteria bacterium 45_16_T64]|nr:short-chain dehydrogenase [Gammaproteobacteria bacterium 45_16_T64]
MKNWVILGATSAIAEEVMRLWASRGYKLFLVARNQDKMDIIKEDLSVRGAMQVETFVMDANEITKHISLLEEADKRLGHVDGVFVAHGTLPDQKACEKSYEAAYQEIHTNALSVISLLTEVANRFESRGHGDIAVISSVAGDRGRQSNYVYGAAKALLSTYLQGLRNRLVKSNVHVLTIKPGFVDTPMTADFDKGALWASTEQVATGIVNAVDKKRNEAYLPGFWWAIMFIIKHVPEFIFKKLSM